MLELKEITNIIRESIAVGLHDTRCIALPTPYIARLFEFCFGGSLPETDLLLDKLGQFAAWVLPKLLVDELFRAVLPQMTNHVAKFVLPTLLPPFQDQTPETGEVTRACVFMNGEFSYWYSEIPDEPRKCTRCRKVEEFCWNCGREIVAQFNSDGPDTSSESITG